MSLVTVQNVADHNIDRVKAYLLEHLHCSMFLLSNLESYGPSRGEHFNSGNFKCIYNVDKLSGVFCLTARGNMLITADSAVLTQRGCEQILDQIVAEPINIKCLLGSWNAVETLNTAIIYNGIWQSYSNKSKEDTFIHKEIVNKGTHHSQVRMLQESDFSNWSLLRRAYLEELNLKQELSEEDFKQSFDDMVHANHVWGYFDNNNLVSITACNSQLQDIFQVGGVYTIPSHRSKGIAQKIVLHQFADLRDQQNARVAILFTGETNISARKAYEKIGFERVGEFGIITS